MKKIKINILAAIIAVCFSANAFAEYPDFIITSFTKNGSVTYSSAQHAYVIPVSITFKNIGSIPAFFSVNQRQFGIRFYAYKTSTMTDTYYKFGDLHLEGFAAPATVCTDGGQNCLCIFGDAGQIFLGYGSSKTVTASLVISRIPFGSLKTTKVYLRAEVNSTSCGEFSGLTETIKTNNKLTLAVTVNKPKELFPKNSFDTIPR